MSQSGKQKEFWEETERTHPMTPKDVEKIR